MPSWLPLNISACNAISPWGVFWLVAIIREHLVRLSTSMSTSHVLWLMQISSKQLQCLEHNHRSNLSFVYIPGHQDALSWLEDLPPLARMNVWADSLAKKELHWIATLPGHDPMPDKLQGEQWYAKVPSGKITSDPHLVVLEHLGQREALQYWSHKQQLNALLFNMVHWDTWKKTMKSFSTTFQMWLSKFASGHSAIASAMHHWKCWETATCPVSIYERNYGACPPLPTPFL